MLIKAYLRAVAAFDMVVAVVAGHFRARNAGFRTGSLAARGVTFIEYALLAAIAVAIAILFRSTLTTTFKALLAKFQGEATK